MSLLLVRAAEAAPCVPFKVHRQVILPPAPSIHIPVKLPSGWESALAKRIGAVKTQEAFPEVYRKWRARNRADLNEHERYEWLSCLDHYIHLDTNGDGVPDWSAISDDQPARVLFPQDPDQDGDGVPNILDPDPLVSGEKHQNQGIPAHLRFDALKRPREAQLQRDLFERFGIIAVDHTDEHAVAVLRELFHLLERGFSKTAVKSLSGLRYVYAFAGHDPEHRVAAYHRHARALSVGGVAVYPSGEMSKEERFELLSTLAHEIGHAVLFERLGARRLSETAAKYGGWPAAAPIAPGFSLFSRFFFKPFVGHGKTNMVSQYATTNEHEWFAESFAAHVMLRLAETGSLGENWSDLFTRRTSAASGRWIEYRNLSPAFRSWLNAAFK